MFVSKAQVLVLSRKARGARFVHKCFAFISSRASSNQNKKCTPCKQACGVLFHFAFPRALRESC